MKSRLCFMMLLGCLLLGCQKSIETSTGNVTVKFVNNLQDAPLTLNTKTYTNPSGESYTISKLRYYVTNVQLNSGSTSSAEGNSYHLVDAALPSSETISYQPDVNTYSGIEFLLGVDSLRNVSGAQTGALDPLNDMFWTWNSGYVMFKMEGNSAASPVVGNKFEYHIGGFSGPDNVLKKIRLEFPADKLASIQKGETCEIIIEAALDRFWQAPNPLSIAATPVCTTPGTQARKIADNYQNIFTLFDVINNK